MANPPVGVISRAALCASLPETIEIRESQKGGKYPLYVATPFGSWFMNSPAGQAHLKEYGILQPEEPEPSPEPDTGQEPGPDAKPETRTESEPEPEKPGFLSTIFGGGDDDE